MKVSKLTKRFIIILFMALFLFNSAEKCLAQNTGQIDQLIKYLEQNPEDISKRIELAEKYVENGAQSQAIKQYEKVVEIAPDNAEAWSRLAQLYSWNNAQVKVIDCYEKIIEICPNDTNALQQLGQFYTWENRQKEAIVVYHQLSGLNPGNLEYREKLAQLYSWNKMPQQAIREYEKILARDSSDLVTMKKLVPLYFSAQKPDQGLSLLEKIAALEPDSLAIRRQLAQQYVWNNLQDKAIAEYKEILKRDLKDLELMEKLAQLYMWNEQPREAAILYRHILKFKPDKIELHLMLAKALLWTNQGKLAEPHLKIVVDNEPNNQEALLTLAEIQYWGGRWKSARGLFKRALQLDSANKKARKFLHEINKKYGALAEIRYKHLSDSNLLTREQIPFSVTYFQNKYWEYSTSAFRNRIVDDRIDSTLIGYGGLVSAKCNLSLRTSILASVSATSYSNNWKPVSLKLQFNQSFAEKVYTNILYHREESQEGARALNNKIFIYGVKSEMYAQVHRRWSLSAMADYSMYSDDNRKSTCYAATKYTMRLKNPKLSAIAYCAYEDFKWVYPLSIPYWTPDQLSTASAGLDAEQKIWRWLTIGGGYSITHQKDVYSQNYNVRAKLNFTQRDKLFIRYEKMGSEVYWAKVITAYFQHRF